MCCLFRQIAVFRTPYIKTYRAPTPLLFFQLALIPGSFLTGFLLSPVLILSRKFAQRPAYRLRHPAEKDIYRKALAASFYVGSLLICGGIIGSWMQWCLDGRNPWLWVLTWLMEGHTWWTRPALITYWGLLAAISVAGWTRQLIRSRKHRSWVATKTNDGTRRISVMSSAVQTATHVCSVVARPSSTVGTILSDGQGSMGKVASQVMDGVDQRLPKLSVNARRKYFHALAVVLFVPGMIIDVS